MGWNHQLVFLFFSAPIQQDSEHASNMDAGSVFVKASQSSTVLFYGSEGPNELDEFISKL